MSSTFSIALSALQADSEAISITGNNLSNLNTTGFKGSAVDFEDLMSQAMGGQGGGGIGMGVGAPIAEQVFSQGSMQSSTEPLAAAIQGNGFFVVQNSSGQLEFTRDGSFTLSANGVLQTQTGENVQGWMATNGVVNPSGATSNLVFPSGTLLPAKATANISADINLDPGTSTSGATFSSPIQVIDSLGNTHTLTMNFTQTSANAWSYNVSVPATDLSNQTWAAGTAYTVGETIVDASGHIQKCTTAGTSAASAPTFNDGGGTTTDGSVTWTDEGTSEQLLSSPGTLAFNTDGTLASSTTSPVTLSVKNLADGASNMSINWNLLDSSGNGMLTQYVEASSLSNPSQDGAQAAQLSQITMSNGGQIMATYSNGQQVLAGQIALASINNPDSLVNNGNNNFVLSGQSGTPAIGMPQAGGRGQIIGGSLEGSNVDMGTQLTNLIVFQSSYGANSKVITTANTMSQDLLQLIQ